jgi:hypothetical protein
MDFLSFKFRKLSFGYGVIVIVLMSLHDSKNLRLHGVTSDIFMTVRLGKSLATAENYGPLG